MFTNYGLYQPIISNYASEVKYKLDETILKSDDIPVHVEKTSYFAIAIGHFTAYKTLIIYAKMIRTDVYICYKT